MRYLILFLLLLIGSVWAGIELMRHPGYMLIVYQPWMVQMPIWFAVLTGIIILVLFYLIIDSIDRIQFLWYRFKNWLRFRREHRSYSKTQQGLAALIEEQWKRAEYLLLAGINQTVDPLINYLGAAKAAHAQHAYDRRDDYIQKAYQVAPHAELAIGLTRAEFELDQNQLEHAAATLNHLRQQSPRHPRVLKLLEKVYVRLSDWKHLLALLPSLRKAKVLNAEQNAQFEKNIYCEILNTSSPKSIVELKKIWDNLPRNIKKDPEVVTAYIKQLLAAPYIREDAVTQAEMSELIRKTLKNHWQPDLVKIYGLLPSDDLNRELVTVGNWLKVYGPRPEILLLLGKLCVRVQLWGKAKDYFERCLAQGPNPEASLEYGKLLEQLHEANAALQKYRESLEQLTNVATMPKLIVSTNNLVVLKRDAK